MITCDKGNVKTKGNLTLLETETVVILKRIRNAIEEEYGKEHTERSMQKIFELSTMTREEIEAETEKAVREIARKIAEHLVKEELILWIIRWEDPYALECKTMTRLEVEKYAQENQKSAEVHI